ncbi:acyl-CoA dehydrogenase family protein [uncultured Jatrophihabitans sp.]|uniref:acyl-CoA dehydrogenase family protein n=1 Tax=uncultured Jatrophihabitans sp. TaxID=1610747 RepID=UPI0035CB248F
MTATTERPAWSDDDLEAFRDLAHSFLEKECAPHEQRWAEQQHVDREVWNKAGELGLLCPSIPEQYGGGGGTFAHEAVLAEEQVRTGAPSLGTAVHSTIVAHYLNGYGTEEQKRTWLPQLASGELVGAVAMTEPGTGSDLQAVATKAIRDGDTYVIDGSKTFISNGLQAEFIVVVAKTDPENKAAGISLICVDTRGLEGFSRGRVLKKIGQHGQDTAELFFDGVRVPTTNLLGEVEGQGFIQLMQQLPQERLVLAVAAIAAIEETIAVTLKYTKERHAFGKPVFNFQNTKFKLAEAATNARIGRVFIDDCIAKHLDGRLDVPTASMAKWWLTQQQCDIADECLQFFGGYGYMEEYPISRMYTDARIQKIYGGTNEIMKEIISRFL